VKVIEVDIAVKRIEDDLSLTHTRLFKEKEIMRENRF
jgi:hypothetical protein